MSSCFHLLALGLQTRVSCLTYYINAGESNSGVCVYVAGTLLTEPCSQPQVWFVSIFPSITALFIISISLYNLFQCSQHISINTTSTLLLSVKFTSKFCIWWIGKNNGFVSLWPVFSHNGRDKWPKSNMISGRTTKEMECYKGTKKIGWVILREKKAGLSKKNVCVLEARR